MQKLLKKLKDPEYAKNLVDQRKKIKNDIVIYQKKISDLKNKLKLGEIQLNRKMKQPSNKEVELRRIAYDCSSKQNEYNSLINKVERNKLLEKSNDTQIKELKEMKDKLEQIAREMYGITNFIDVKGQMKKKEKYKKEKNKFQKNLEIINNLIESNKRKYKIIISQNEKEIFKLEQKKIQLLKKLKNEEISNNDVDKEIKEFLGNEMLINNENKDKEKEKDNGNINNIKNDDGIIYGKLVVKNGEDEINKNKNINSGINY